jgi:hypothetical protein
LYCEVKPIDPPQTPDDTIHPLPCMGKFQRRHKKKKEKRKQAMTLAAKDWMRGVVVLRSTDGMELVVPKAEARRYGTKVEDGIRHHH